VRRTCPAPLASSGRESTIILIPLQVAFFILITGVLVGTSVEKHRRNRRSWPAIVDRMSPEAKLQWNTSASVPRPEVMGEVWIGNPRAAFRDSGVMMEMADYAERNAPLSDSTRMQTVRTAAVKLRTVATRRLIEQVFTR